LKMAYDEVLHSSDAISVKKILEHKSDVCFIGTWMRYEARDDFLLKLVDRGVNVSIWGDRWHKSRHWARIQSHWRGPALSGQDYVAAIRGAKVCLGLLSKGNRDLHTTRSMEIPYAGGLLCAERTSEHLELYREDEEAVFWSSAEECAAKCLALLQDDDRREQIRLAGMRRVRENKVGNEDICRHILNAVTK
jgi:spore maturation protein CgeB